jgi:hypothetical protein
LSKLILGRYTRGGLWSLFLMSALLQHAWTIILAFNDVGWLTERTNAWDAIGVLSYGLLFALIESALLFVLFALLGLLLPRRWEAERRVAVLSCLVLVLSIWAIVSQWFFLAHLRFSAGIIGFLVESGHPLWVIYGVLAPIVLASFGLPFWATTSRGGLKFVSAMIERLGLLATLYLFFDALALIVIVIRNL